MLKQSFSS